MKKTGVILDVVSLVLSAVLCFGTKFAFHACAPKEDGSWMACHWAEQAVFGIGIVLLILSVIMTFCFKDGHTKSGIAVSMAVLSGFTAILPNHLIKICMMADMRCHSVMKPAVLVTGILLCIVSVVGCVMHRKEEQA